MSVVEDIISYLFINKILNEEDMRFLEQGGYYRRGYTDEDYDSLSSAEDEDSKIIEGYNIEGRLTDSRRKKQGKKGGVFNGAKKRHVNNKDFLIKQRLNKLNGIWWNAPPSLWWTYERDTLEGKILNLLKKKDFSLYLIMRLRYLDFRIKLGQKRKVHGQIVEGPIKMVEFWNYFIKTYGSKILLQWSELLISDVFEVKNSDDKSILTIRPNAFYELKNKKNIINEKGWALRLSIDKNICYSITNEFGEKDLKKINL